MLSVKCCTRCHLQFECLIAGASVWYLFSLVSTCVSVGLATTNTEHYRTDLHLHRLPCQYPAVQAVHTNHVREHIMLPNTRKLIILISALTSLVLIRKILSREKSSDVDYPGYKNCYKKHKIGFLKTHKCASSSVQNILFRFGLKNHLTFALPSAGNYLGRYVKYSKAMLANTVWDKVGLDYDIFALHTIWNKAEVERTLGPGAVYITILRDPVELFESLWVYAGLQKYYNIDLESFALAEKEGKLAQRAYRSELQQG